jgi:hypothetical protein
VPSEPGRPAEPSAPAATPQSAPASDAAKPSVPAPVPEPVRAPVPEPGAEPPAAARRGPGGLDSRAAAEQAVTAALANLQHGLGPGEVTANYQRALEGLADPSNKSPVNAKLLKMLPIVNAGLRDPALYGAVIGEAWERAVLSGKDINGALVEMAKESGLEVKTVGQVKPSSKFFAENATKPKAIVDKGAGDDHGIHTHLLQELVVSRALRAAGRNESAAEFRSMLARVKGRMPGGDISLGDLIWRVTYDLEAIDHINDPETLREALRPFGFR